jgi:hypothetical protein
MKRIESRISMLNRLLKDGYTFPLLETMKLSVASMGLVGEEAEKTVYHILCEVQ